MRISKVILSCSILVAVGGAIFSSANASTQRSLRQVRPVYSYYDGSSIYCLVNNCSDINNGIECTKYALFDDYLCRIRETVYLWRP